jgi:hypothetical protein
MGDELEILKTATTAAVKSAFEPFTDLMSKLFGPAAEECGLMFRDHVTAFRIKRQVRLFGAVDRMLKDASLEPQEVPLKTLLPIVEAASLEESDDLQDRWAALLANAATVGVHPAYPEILKQLSADDVSLLAYAYDQFMKSPFVLASRSSGGTRNEALRLDLDDIFSAWMSHVKRQLHGYVGFDRSEFVGNLTRLGLMEEKPDQTVVQVRVKDGKPESTPVIETKLRFTQLGLSFVRACHAPKGKDKTSSA